MKILIQGAGIAGCTLALALAKQKFDVTVVERRTELFTDGAGIVLYSNALKFLDTLDVLNQILDSGVSMGGNTEIWNQDSSLIGVVKYKTVDERYSSYMGINRNLFLKILYKNAICAGAKFNFGTTVQPSSITTNKDDLVYLSNSTSGHFDLIIAADGTNSNIRNYLYDNQQSVFVNYGLWHSLHQRRPEINEKITVMGPKLRLGVIPLNDETMYVWASNPEMEKIYIPKENQPKIMKEKFSCFTGIAGEIIGEINTNSYVHYTSVEEVYLPKPWHKGNVVFVGDSAHASLPFMAQGGAQAIHDAVSLSQFLIMPGLLDDKLLRYANFRYDVARLVQATSHKIGEKYKLDQPVDIKSMQLGADSFYENFINFKLPEEI